MFFDALVHAGSELHTVPLSMSHGHRKSSITELFQIPTTEKMAPLSTMKVTHNQLDSSVTLYRFYWSVRSKKSEVKPNAGNSPFFTAEFNVCNLFGLKNQLCVLHWQPVDGVWFVFGLRNVVNMLTFLQHNKVDMNSCGYVCVKDKKMKAINYLL